MIPLIIILSILAFLILLITIIIILGETDLFHKESDEYEEPDLSKLMHETCAPVYPEDEPKSENAILFIHGFAGNPSTFHYFSQRAKKDGFDVVMPLLPGAGTTKEDFKKSNFSQRYLYLKETYLKYRKKYKNFFLAGLSLGGTLALKLTQEFNDSTEYSPTGLISIVAGVIYFSPKYNTPAKTLTIPFLRAAGWFTDEVSISNKHKETGDGVERNRSYKGIFPRQLYSSKAASGKIKRDLYKIKVPTFLAHARGDKVVPFANIFYIADHISSKKVKMKIYDIGEQKHAQHNLAIYNSTRDDLYEEMMFFIKQNLK